MQPNVKSSRYTPVVFHNLSGYDAHLFIRELGKKCYSGSIGVIAENKEKYISFNVDVVVDRGMEKGIQPRFIDSAQFMVSSLDSLSRNLVEINGMRCNQSKRKAELTNIDGNYVAHGACGKCGRDNHRKLRIKPIFDNLRVRHTDEQFLKKESLSLLINGQLGKDQREPAPPN